MSGIPLDRLIEAVGRDVEAGVRAADEAASESGTDSPFAVTSAELVVPFEATVEDSRSDEDGDGKTTLLLGVGKGDGRLTLRYRPVAADELSRVVAEPPELSGPRATRLAGRLRALTPEAAARLVEADLLDPGAVADAGPRRLDRLLRGTDVDPELVARAAGLAALGADPVTADLLARAGVDRDRLARDGAGEAFDRLQAAVRKFPDRAPPDYRVDYAELDALAAAADR